ncbi:MAG: glucoamylase family protein [Bacilli bacterium]|nr:glucoamylase family protein [Bacilli bacterium]
MNDLRKKRLLVILILVLIFPILFACREDEYPPENNKKYRTEVLTDVSEVILEELELGFKFFYETANNNEDSKGYGLIPDRFHAFGLDGGNAGKVASIASVGFGLTALPIGIENEWITREEGEERAFLTLKTISELERTHGFWFHFIDIDTGARVWDSEVSIIDSAILINGVLTVGKYFGGRVQQLANKLYKEIEWDWYYDENANKFYMGYDPLTGFSGYWNGYAEQLMVFVLAAGSPTHPVGVNPYNLMKLTSKKHNATPEYGSFYSTYTGSIFTHQFSHAWIDFQAYVDVDGYNWFNNSVNASKAAIAYAVSLKDEYPGINENSWGMSAADGPEGYKGNYGSGPSEGNAHYVDGTVPAYGAIGSIVFVPKQAISAAENYRSYNQFWSKYGFKDSYNLGYQNQNWYASDIIGIDKGISVLMIENYLSGMIWKIFMEIEYIQDGLENLNFKRVEV